MLPSVHDQAALPGQNLCINSSRSWLVKQHSVLVHYFTCCVYFDARFSHGRFLPVGATYGLFALLMWNKIKMLFILVGGERNGEMPRVHQKNDFGAIPYFLQIAVYEKEFLNVAAGLFSLQHRMNRPNRLKTSYVLQKL